MTDVNGLHALYAAMLECDQETHADSQVIPESHTADLRSVLCCVVPAS